MSNGSITSAILSVHSFDKDSFHQLWFSKKPEANIKTVTKIAVALIAPKIKPKPLSKKLNPIALRNFQTIEPDRFNKVKRIKKRATKEAIDFTCVLLI